MDEEAPIPSEPILSEEESVRQIHLDMTKGYRERIRQLEQELQQARNELARLNGQTQFICECGGTKVELQQANHRYECEAERVTTLINKLHTTQNELQQAREELEVSKSYRDMEHEARLALVQQISTNYIPREEYERVKSEVEMLMQPCRDDSCAKERNELSEKLTIYKQEFERLVEAVGNAYKDRSADFDDSKLWEAFQHATQLLKGGQ